MLQSTNFTHTQTITNYGIGWNSFLAIVEVAIAKSVEGFNNDLLRKKRISNREVLTSCEE
ncbi:Fructose-1-6-bisphosphatase domain containing protein [Sesbania bispinosa]|nr:Fructose-1-6-bisphosphatase domain containing protein [Sesbania bispinosa]